MPPHSWHSASWLIQTLESVGLVMHHRVLLLPPNSGARDELSRCHRCCKHLTVSSGLGLASSLTDDSARSCSSQLSRSWLHRDEVGIEELSVPFHLFTIMKQRDEPNGIYGNLLPFAPLQEASEACGASPFLCCCVLLPPPSPSSSSAVTQDIAVPGRF